MRYKASLKRRKSICTQPRTPVPFTLLLYMWYLSFDKWSHPPALRRNSCKRFPVLSEISPVKLTKTQTYTRTYPQLKATINYVCLKERVFPSHTRPCLLFTLDFPLGENGPAKWIICVFDCSTSTANRLISGRSLWTAAYAANGAIEGPNLVRKCGDSGGSASAQRRWAINWVVRVPR